MQIGQGLGQPTGVQICDAAVESLSKRTAGPRAGTDFMRRIGAAHRDLGVLVEHSLPLGRNVRPNCRTEKGGNAYAGYRHRRPPHLHRRVCLLCRAAAPRVAAARNCDRKGSEMTGSSDHRGQVDEHEHESEALDDRWRAHCDWRSHRWRAVLCFSGPGLHTCGSDAQLSILFSWSAPPGTITTESNAAYKAGPTASTVRRDQVLESWSISPERGRICIGGA
jgi:hypothetical protein